MSIENLDFFKEVFSKDELKVLIEGVKKSKKAVKTDDRDNMVVAAYLEKLLNKME